MPYLKLNTNVAVAEDAKPELLSELSQLMATETGKPERYVMVMVELAGDKAMLFGGSNQPMAYLECKSIGLSSTQTKPLAAAICQLLQSRLQIEPQRIYIEFSDCPANYWGWNGSTFG